ncbi:MAG: helix-turn-helix domain-containing protein [bacterium]|nr:helix-turn-helix domain-containing protein [bacterium]
MDTQTFKVRDKRKADWFSVDNVFLDLYAKHFGAIGTAVYIALCRRADEDEKCFPSQQNIGEMLGINRRTVNPYLQRLEKANIISVTKKFRDKHGKWLHNVYWLIDKSEWMKPEEIVSHGYGGKIKMEPRENNATHQENHIPTNNTQNNNTHKNNTNKAKQSFADTDAIIEKFKAVNPDYESFYKNTTQRKATERLIQKMGIEPLTAVIDELAGAVAKPFCPVITSPYTLEKKLADLFIFLQRQKRDNFGGGIAGITKPFKKNKYAHLV